MQSVFLTLFVSVFLGDVKVTHAATYGLPDPVHRYKLVDPIQRSRTTSTTTSLSSLGLTPNPNAPIYSSDFSLSGYFQPKTNPQYIRNATCTWVPHSHLLLNSLQVRGMF